MSGVRRWLAIEAYVSHCSVAITTESLQPEARGLTEDVG